MKANNDTRNRLKAAGIPVWRLAAEVGVSEATLTRWFRFELEGERETRVQDALQRLEGGAR